MGVGSLALALRNLLIQNIRDPNQIDITAIDGATRWIVKVEVALLRSMQFIICLQKRLCQVFRSDLNFHAYASPMDGRAWRIRSGIDVTAPNSTQSSPAKSDTVAAGAIEMQTFDTADERETVGNGSNETKALAAVVFRNPRLFIRCSL
ncbi:hypothetical protein VWY34_15405 [Phaeobacter sp. JH20_02]|uniref:hypothetical protein n=1 Tax=Phaeobacter sp. JH20_02 TaxID=3112461 RepID=UPI003A8A9505